MIVADNILTAQRASLRGRSAELLVAAAACEMGFTAALVLSFYAKYDLLIDTGHAILRIQVKLAQWIPQRQRAAGNGDRACWRVCLRSDAPSTKRRYTEDDFDVLAIVCQPGRIYFVPITQLLGDDGRLLRHVHVKPDDPALTRVDAKQAAERWTAYLNVLPVDVPRGTAAGVSA